MQKYYIQDQHLLTDICQQLAKSAILAIDTEFVRTRTYYPKLGLLQVCNGEIIALIDPVALADLSPFWQLLTNKNIRKVLHACSEDLDVFLSCALFSGQNCKPVNMIDSQIMMAFLGHGLSLGYAAMIKHFTEVELDKSESRTDWIKRPLTERQLSYAQADVDYLYQVYPKIVAQLEQKQLMMNALEETANQIEKKFTPIDENLLFLDIKQSWRLNAQQLNRLKQLAKWRYNRAKQRDLPLSFVVKDQTLIALSQRDPNNVGAMANIENIDILDIRHQGKAMLAVLRQVAKDETQNYPAAIVRLDQHPGYKGNFKKIKSFIAEIAALSGLTIEILASKKQINKFLSWHYKLNNAEQKRDEVDFLQGWRFELFGQQLQKLVEKDS